MASCSNHIAMGVRPTEWFLSWVPIIPPPHKKVSLHAACNLISDHQVSMLTHSLTDHYLMSSPGGDRRWNNVLGNVQTVLWRDLICADLLPLKIDPSGRPSVFFWEGGTWPLSVLAFIYALLSGASKSGALNPNLGRREALHIPPSLVGFWHKRTCQSQ